MSLLKAMQHLLFLTLFFLVALSSVEARSSNSKLPSVGYKMKNERENMPRFKTDVLAAAPAVAKSNDLESNFYKFTAGMFSFFAVGMLIGQNRMYGPQALSPLLQYWTKENASAVTEWFGRFFGAAMLILMTGPKYFGVPMSSWLKQSMALAIWPTFTLEHRTIVLRCGYPS